MKNILLLLLLSLVLFGCKKEKSNPAFNVVITGTTSADPNSRAYVIDLEEQAELNYIARYAYEISCRSTEFPHINPARGFTMSQRDTINGKLFMIRGDAVNEQPEAIYPGYFISDWHHSVITIAFDATGRLFDQKLSDMDVHFEHPFTIDTIAYIPEQVVAPARVKMMEAFQRQDYDECYRLLEESFIYVPCTGEEYRAMEAAGLE